MSRHEQFKSISVGFSQFTSKEAERVDMRPGYYVLVTGIEKNELTPKFISMNSQNLREVVEEQKNYGSINYGMGKYGWYFTIEKYSPDTKSVWVKASEKTPSDLELEAFVTQEYIRKMSALVETGIVIKLPKSGIIGVVNLKGNEYPVPTLEETKVIFQANKDLVNRKRVQGFTRMLLTPIAATWRTLSEKTNKEVDRLNLIPIDNSKTTKPNEEFANADKELVLLANKFNKKGDGYKKSQAIKNRTVCAVPGWSIGLIEDMDTIPEDIGRSGFLGNRLQYLAGYSANTYLTEIGNSRSKKDPYYGETGWTIEDFYTQSATYIRQKQKIPHIPEINKAVILFGTFNKKFNTVPVGCWRESMNRIGINFYTPDRYDMSAGARTIVRLPWNTY